MHWCIPVTLFVRRPSRIKMIVGKLYFPYESPPARSVLLTLEALDIKVEKIVIDMLNGEHLTPEYIKMNPQHTAPLYIDQDGSKIWDSHAICIYLVSKYGKTDELYPKDVSKQATVNQRLFFDAECIYPFARETTLGMLGGGWTSVPERISEKTKLSYGFLNTFLDGQEWVCGNTVTIADFCIMTSVSLMELFIPIDDYSNLVAWMKRCERWPFYKTAHAPGAARLKAFVQSGGFMPK